MKSSTVALVKCDSYDSEKVYQALTKGIALIGGVSQFIAQTERVLLKPNLLSGKVPAKAVTTHPAVFEAMIRVLRDGGYQNVSYGDSPGIGSPESVAAACGLKEVADRYGVILKEFSKGTVVSFPAGRVCKSFEIAQAVLESDALISISKMKAHQLTRITGAIKNQLGCVYGLNKVGFHAKFPGAIDFSQMLVDLNMLLKPRLYIMDGIVAMEGNGPASGVPKQMNVLLVSTDPVALDAVFCRLVDLDPEYIPAITAGSEFGLGNYKEADIKLVGDGLAEFIAKDFDVERVPVKNENFSVFISSLKNLLIRRPVIDPQKCIKCGICVDACPVEPASQKGALFFKNNDRSNPPIYNYSKCIRCYCCQEMCPQKAIGVKLPLLGKLFLYR